MVRQSRGTGDVLEDGSSDGTTPLDPDEAEGLIPDLQTRGELNAWEQANILKAERWGFSRRNREILTIDFATELHRRMLDETWSWAGRFRHSDKNVGVHWPNIPQSLRNVIDNTAFWLENRTYSIDEAAAHFHHELVLVHPFPNGNGRHGRLMADLFLWKSGSEPFSWGRRDLGTSSDVRSLYLSALRQADQGNIQPLLRFARS